MIITNARDKRIVQLRHAVESASAAVLTAAVQVLSSRQPSARVTPRPPIGAALACSSSNARENAGLALPLTGGGLGSEVRRAIGFVVHATL